MICPECANGKHPNCTGWAIDAETDCVVDCACDHESDDVDEDWSTPEGYDDSPDQGVHRYDGGGTFW